MTASYSHRVTSALSARSILENDFFGGWEISDLDLFSRHKFTTSGTPGFVTDYFGIKTAVAFVPWAEGNSGGVFTDPPLPDDGVRAIQQATQSCGVVPADQQRLLGLAA